LVLGQCLAAQTSASEVAHWIKMPILTPEQKEAGVFPGGEGAQWPRGPIAISPADPDFLLLPIDVGGVYRSLDGGRYWEIAMVGWNARGANGFAIDPRNANRAVGIGANSANWNPNWGPSPEGLYLTTNQAASWQQVKVLPGAFGGNVVFDPTSYNAAKGFCVVLFYRSNDDGLFRSEDGGETWASMAGVPSPGFHKREGDWATGEEADPRLAINPVTGELYLAGQAGLFCSTNRGGSWTHPRMDPVYSLAVTLGGTVLISDPYRVLSSPDDGKTWVSLAGKGLDTTGGRHIQDLAISPADPNRMHCWITGGNFVWERFVTHDGGTTWNPVKVERDAAPLPMNRRQGYCTWSPGDPQLAWSIGGDWVVKSGDGGNTFHWSNNGYNGVMCGGTFAFNPFDRNLVLLGFQDYNGAFTTDGGKTWNYRDISGKGWGGHEYGAYALNRNVMWCGDANDWSAPRQLRITRDGGESWSFVNGPDGKALHFRASESGFGDPGDDRIGFAGDLRTADGGATWNSMPDCDQVLASGFTSQELYGGKGSDIVCSTNHGLTWTKLTQVPGGISDLAVDDVGRRVYVASQDRLKVFHDGVWTTLATPADQYGNCRVTTVAIDPLVPAVVYVGGPRNTYTSKATVCRSTDCGKTWRNLTVNTPLSGQMTEGPHEVSMIRVNPFTREAWVAGQCFGMWRIAPPSPLETGVSADEASAPRAVPTP
jgi:hypothetical protein